MIIIRNLTKVYETKNYNIIALSNINLSFSKGEIIVILGRSGSGKSTFLNILGGFDNSYSGRYIFKTHEFKNMDDRQIDSLRSKSIGFVFQHQVLFNHLTVIENVELALDVLGVTNDKGKRINAMKALTLVGLKRHAYKFPWQLSGGEKQRLAIARAIVKDPEVIVCDEPTAALDSITSKEILDLLASVCKDKILIIATHNKSIVKNYGTRLIELRSGYLVRNEIIDEDKSNVELGEYDELLDQTLYNEDYVSLNKVTQIKIKDKNETSKILQDLQLDLSQFTKKQEDEFYLDTEEYRRVLEKRKSKFNKEEKFSIIGRSSSQMVNTEDYSKKSFVYHKRIYSFFSIFLFLFIIIMVLSFNLTQEMFIKNNNMQRIQIQKIKNNVYLELEDKNITGLYKTEGLDLVDLSNDFVKQDDLKQEDIILNDASFNFRYIYDSYHYLQDYLIELGHIDDQVIIYDTKNFIYGEKNEDIIFNNLQMRYKVYQNKQRTTVSHILNHEVKQPLSYLYAEQNKDLSTYLIKGGRLPKNENEVVIPIESLMNVDIIKIESTNVNEIYDQFMNLPKEDQYIIVSQTMVTYENNQFVETVFNHRFQIVGLLNSGKTIDDAYKSPRSVSMIFSTEAKDKVNIGFSNIEPSRVSRIPLYMEINEDTYYKENVNEVLRDYQRKYIETETNMIRDALDDLQKPLIGALGDIQIFFKSNNNASSDELMMFLLKLVDDPLFEQVNFREIIHVYLAFYIDFLEDEKKTEFCIDECDFDSIKSNMETILNLHGDTLYPLLSELSIKNSYLTDKTINYLIFDNLSHQFNNSYNGQRYEDIVLYHNSSLTNSLYKELYEYIFNFDKVKKSDYESKGFTKYIKEDKIEDYAGVLKLTPESLKQNFIIFLMTYRQPSVNLKAVFFSGIILIIIIMLILSSILSKLFGNIYHLFFINRRHELGSLRILGAKFQDMKRIISLESHYMFQKTYIKVIVFLIMLKVIVYPFRNSRIFNLYLYESDSQTFYNVNLSNFVNFNILTLIIVYFVMKWIFKKVLCDRNITKKLKDINTMNSIINWDGE